MQTFRFDTAEMTSEKWQKLFDTRSLYRLLYALQIVDDITLRRETSVNQDPASRQRWCEAFIKQGGVSHLIKILVDGSLISYSSQIHGPRPIYHDVLSVLFRLINNFLCLDSGAFNGVSSQIPDVKSIKVVSTIKNWEGVSNQLVFKCAIPVLLQLDIDADGSNDVIASVLSLMVGCIRSNSALLTTLTEHTGLDQLLIMTLLRNSSSDTRTQSARALYELAKSGVSANRLFWFNRLFSLLRSDATRQYSQSSEQLFYLLAQFVEETGANSLNGVHGVALKPRVEELATFLLSFLYSIRSIEVRNRATKNDLN